MSRETATQSTQRHSILRPLRISNNQLAPIEIHVFDTQPQAFIVPEPTTVEKLPKQQWNSPHLTQHGRDFCLRQHNGDSFRLLRSFRIEIGELALHHIAKQEQ
jgi:hypothetical protein